MMLERPNCAASCSRVAGSAACPPKSKTQSTHAHTSRAGALRCLACLSPHAAPNSASQSSASHRCLVTTDKPVWAAKVVQGWTAWWCMRAAHSSSALMALLPRPNALAAVGLTLGGAVTASVLPPSQLWDYQNDTPVLGVQDDVGFPVRGGQPGQKEQRKDHEGVVVPLTLPPRIKLCVACSRLHEEIAEARGFEEQELEAGPHNAKQQQDDVPKPPLRAPARLGCKVRIAQVARRLPGPGRGPGTVAPSGRNGRDHCSLTRLVSCSVECDIQRCSVSDVVVCQHVLIPQLLPLKDQALLVGRDAPRLLVLDLALHLLDGVREFQLQRDRLPRQRLDKDLHCNVVVRKRPPILQLLPRKDQTLLVRSVPQPVV
eukprot:614080-Rhodomonas_salina.1